MSNRKKISIIIEFSDLLLLDLQFNSLIKFEILYQIWWCTHKHKNSIKTKLKLQDEMDKLICLLIHIIYIYIYIHIYIFNNKFVVDERCSFIMNDNHKI